MLYFAAEMETGWPAFRQSAAAGHGNEAQISRDQLAMAIQDMVRLDKRRVTFVIPNNEQGALSRLYSEQAAVESVEYGYEAVTVVATVDDRVYGMMKKYDPNAKTIREEDTW